MRAAIVHGSSLFEVAAQALEEFQILFSVPCIPEDEEILEIQISSGERKYVKAGTVREWAKGRK